MAETNNKDRQVPPLRSASHYLTLLRIWMIDDVVVFLLFRGEGREGGREVCGTGESGGSFLRDVDGVEGYARLLSFSLSCLRSFCLSITCPFISVLRFIAEPFPLARPPAVHSHLGEWSKNLCTCLECEFTSTVSPSFSANL